jgi:hypothetical protein
MAGMLDRLFTIFGETRDPEIMFRTQLAMVHPQARADIVEALRAAPIAAGASWGTVRARAETDPRALPMKQTPLNQSHTFGSAFAHEWASEATMRGLQAAQAAQRGEPDSAVRKAVGKNLADLGLSWTARPGIAHGRDYLVRYKAQLHAQEDPFGAAPVTLSADTALATVRAARSVGRDPCGHAGAGRHPWQWSRRARPAEQGTRTHLAVVGGGVVGQSQCRGGGDLHPGLRPDQGGHRDLPRPGSGRRLLRRRPAGHVAMVAGPCPPGRVPPRVAPMARRGLRTDRDLHSPRPAQLRRAEGFPPAVSTRCSTTPSPLPSPTRLPTRGRWSMTRADGWPTPRPTRRRGPRWPACSRPPTPRCSRAWARPGPPQLPSSSPSASAPIPEQERHELCDDHPTARRRHSQAARPRGCGAARGDGRGRRRGRHPRPEG